MNSAGQNSEDREHMPKSLQIKGYELRVGADCRLDPMQLPAAVDVEGPRMSMSKG